MSEPEATTPARGSDADYCSAYPDEGHCIESLSAGEKVRWVERCSLCGWINKEALDGWADNAIKESLTERAQRIAVATGTEPFAFVQHVGQARLPIEEILIQALAAAESNGVDGVEGPADGQHARRQAIASALFKEVQVAVARSTKPWTDLAYELYALSCNSKSIDPAHQEEWEKARMRLRDRFHFGLQTVRPEDRPELPSVE